MVFLNEFLLQSIIAASFSLFFFALPGVLSGVLLGITKRPNFTLILLSPALGLCAFGSFSLLCAWMFGYSALNILISWLIFVSGTYVYLFKMQRIDKKRFFSRDDYWLIGAAMLWAVVPTINIYPQLYEQGLFVNVHIFDHMKIAIINSIVRQGLPPVNPFYAPLGEHISLVYYYAWHFNASLIKLLTGVSGWQAEVGLMWLTSFSGILLLAALAIRITQKRVTGYYVLLLALVAPYFDLLSPIFGARWSKLFNHPDIHGLEVLWVQLSWAPQHAFAALSSVILVFLISHALLNKKLRWQHAVLIGLTASAGFGSSVWVGGIALVCVAPCVLFMLKLSRTDCSDMLMPLILALLVCIICSLPVLTAIISGPPSDGGFPLTLKTYTSTRLLNNHSVLQKIIHFVLYWWQFLPLSFGIVYVSGILSAFTYRPKDPEIRLFFHLSLVFIFTYLLLVQFVQSDISNNDFGWRAVLVPFMLLLIWAAVMLTQLPGNDTNWHPFAVALSRQYIFIPLLWIGITLGLLSAFYAWHWPKPNAQYNPPTASALSLHQDFLQLSFAWLTINQHTNKSDLVQSNPDSPYNTVVTPWNAPAALALFGDRSAAYTEPESVNVFAYSYNQQQKQAQYLAVKAIFAESPTQDVLLYARDTLNIKVLLVDHHDPVWASQSIENSGVFSLLEARPTYKIYLAKAL
ncbi:MAG: hypothetical protein P1P78_13240 [Methyloprofundus sp.]|nr:hypothetical protein [Methyloprofundus sp.]